jgi:uroporphyrinogen-III synthase
VLMRALVAADGSVVSRDELAALLPGTPDEHAVEVSMSRLRQQLGTPGLVATVVKRDYRLDV